MKQDENALPIRSDLAAIFLSTKDISATNPCDPLSLWYSISVKLTIVYALAGVVEDTVEKFKADNCEDNDCK